MNDNENVKNPFIAWQRLDSAYGPFVYGLSDADQ